MKVLIFGRFGSPLVRIASGAFGSLVLVAFFGLSAAAQTVSPRPVARLISGSTNEVRTRRISGTDGANFTVTAASQFHHP